MRNIVLLVAILLVCSTVFAGNKNQGENIPVFSDQDLDRYRRPQDTNSAAPQKLPAQQEDKDRSNDIDKASAIDKEEIARTLSDKWKSHVALLKQGKTQDALNNICPGTRADYATMFKALGSNMKQIASTAIGFNLMYVADNIAKFELETNEGGKLYSYEVTFAKDYYGNWCILQY